MRFADFDLYKDLLREKAGIYISADQSYLLDSRLSPVAKKWQYPSVTSMTVALRGIAEPGLIKDVVEAMIDHDTSFIGERSTLAPLREIVLPHLAARRNSKKLRIWHAGCGGGQEPYSIAMFLKENDSHLGGLKPDILATDICAHSLEKAKAAQYARDEVQRGLSARQIVRYFDQKDALWHLKKEIRTMVAFKYANLLENFTALGEFDLVFCRGVLPCLAFDVQPRIVQAIARQTAPGGYLFLHPRERLPEGADAFQPVAGCSGLYVR